MEKIFKLLEGVFGTDVSKREVTVRGDGTCLVDNYEGYGMVAVDYLENQIQVCVLIGIDKRPHGLGPDFHTLHLLALKVTHKDMADHERNHSNGYRSHHECDFHTAYTVCPDFHAC